LVHKGVEPCAGIVGLWSEQSELRFGLRTEFGEGGNRQHQREPEVEPKPFPQTALRGDPVFRRADGIPDDLCRPFDCPHPVEGGLNHGRLDLTRPPWHQLALALTLGGAVVAMGRVRVPKVSVFAMACATA